MLFVIVSVHEVINKKLLYKKAVGAPYALKDTHYDKKQCMSYTPYGVWHARKVSLQRKGTADEQHW